MKSYLEIVIDQTVFIEVGLAKEADKGKVPVHLSQIQHHSCIHN